MAEKKIRVLLVDDHMVVRIGVKALIDSEPDMEVVGEAANGLEAIDQAKRLLPDVIVMDISMPVMDGVEATHEILDYEEDEELPHIPIVALTANALKGDRERFLAEGMDEYTTKPLVKEEIISILKKLLGDKIYDRATDAKGETPSAQTSATPEQTTETEEASDAESEHEVSVEEPQKPTGDTILIFKKSPLENKIFSNLVQQMGHKVEIANTMKQLKEMLNDAIAMIFVDREIDNLDLRELRHAIDEKSGSVALILMTDPSTEVKEEERALSDEVIINLVNRDLIRLIIEKFMNVEG